MENNGCVFLTVVLVFIISLIITLSFYLGFAYLLVKVVKAAWGA